MIIVLPSSSSASDRLVKTILKYFLPQKDIKMLKFFFPLYFGISSSAAIATPKLKRDVYSTFNDR